MSSYCVIGSGISGATIANLLSKKNSVHIYDKARGPGGRSSFKRLNKSKGFDHGAQYISPKSIQFKKFITDLSKKKILKKWTGKHIFLNKLKKDCNQAKAGFLSKRSQFLAFQKKQPQALIDSINWNVKVSYPFQLST